MPSPALSAGPSSSSASNNTSATAAAEAAQARHAQLLATLDLAALPRPFRSTRWKPSARRNRNVRQMVAEEERREAAAVAAANGEGGKRKDGDADGDAADGDAMDVDADDNEPAKPTKYQPPQRQVVPISLTYTNIAAAPSLRPAGAPRYCDITGLIAPYTDPKTRLHYHDREVFRVVRTLDQGAVEAYLEARGAGVVLK